MHLIFAIIIFQCFQKIKSEVEFKNRKTFSLKYASIENQANQIGYQLYFVHSTKREKMRKKSNNNKSENMPVENSDQETNTNEITNTVFGILVSIREKHNAKHNINNETICTERVK